MKSHPPTSFLFLIFGRPWQAEARKTEESFVPGTFKCFKWDRTSNRDPSIVLLIVIGQL